MTVTVGIVQYMTGTVGIVKYMTVTVGVVKYDDCYSRYSEVR